MLQSEKERILTEFSLDNKQGALSRLIEELTEENGALKRGLAEEVQQIVDEFSLDKEESALSRLVRRAREELETARKNRDASVGLFVLSEKTRPEGLDSFLRHGNDIFGVWDAERVESDVILKAGLSLAKALCVRQVKERQADDGNWDKVETAILTLEKESKRLVKMKTMTETIQSKSGKVLEEVRKMTVCLEQHIDTVRESVAALKRQVRIFNSWQEQRAPSRQNDHAPWLKP